MNGSIDEATCTECDVPIRLTVATQVYGAGIRVVAQCDCTSLPVHGLSFSASEWPPGWR